MKPGDRALGWTCPPERASDCHPPVEVILVEPFPWYGRTLWRCEEAATGSRWFWDETWLQPVGCNPGEDVV